MNWRSKKSSDKSGSDKKKSVNVTTSVGSQSDEGEHVQISMYRFVELTKSEDLVKSYEDQNKTLKVEVKDLKGQLSNAHCTLTTVRNLVKQHAKAAEDVVSGPEKTEAEAARLKNLMELVTTLSKLTAEDQATHSSQEPMPAAAVTEVVLGPSIIETSEEKSQAEAKTELLNSLNNEEQQRDLLADAVKIEECTQTMLSNQDYDFVEDEDFEDESTTNGMPLHDPSSSSSNSKKSHWFFFRKAK